MYKSYFILLTFPLLLLFWSTVLVILVLLYFIPILKSDFHLKNICIYLTVLGISCSVWIFIISCEIFCYDTWTAKLWGSCWDSLWHVGSYFSHQGSNLSPLHCMVESQSLDQERRPSACHFSSKKKKA